MITDDEIQKVWDAAKIVEGYNPITIRQDCCGAWIVRSEYGKTTLFGWEVDHVFPESKGGKSDLRNLRAMHWENNRSKADDFPVYNVAVQAKGNQNERVTNVQFRVNDVLREELTRLYQ